MASVRSLPRAVACALYPANGLSQDGVPQWKFHPILLNLKEKSGQPNRQEGTGMLRGFNAAGQYEE
jgi:hypothetical protein